MNVTDFWKRALQLNDSRGFDQLALELFRYQSQHVSVYKAFLEALKVDPGAIERISDIPFMPIELFKNHAVTDQPALPELCFKSSGTTQTLLSHHYVANPSIYNESLIKCFNLLYGDPSQYVFLALLPSYLERSGSSLVYMVQKLIEEGNHPESGFYLNDYGKLSGVIQTLLAGGKKIFLIGVSFALLDLFEHFPVGMGDSIIMETGGMKGKRKELVREELHDILKAASGVEMIHSEYGMTEMLSQAYSKGQGLFECPPWMKVFTHDVYDPFAVNFFGETGTISVIDLANIHSCAFIATRDIGSVNDKGLFKVLGRTDNSDIRGCNLLLA